MFNPNTSVPEPITFYPKPNDSIQETAYIRESAEALCLGNNDISVVGVIGHTFEGKWHLLNTICDHAVFEVV